MMATPYTKGDIDIFGSRGPFVDTHDGLSYHRLPPGSDHLVTLTKQPGLSLNENSPFAMILTMTLLMGSISTSSWMVQGVMGIQRFRFGSSSSLPEDGVRDRGRY